MTSTSKINPSAVGPTSPSIGLKTVTFTSQVFRDPEDFETHRTAGTVCDLELRSYVEPVVHAHKIILLTRNSYFSKHFAAHPDCAHIDLRPPLNAAFVELLIKYIYTGKLEVPITPKDFTHLLITAAHFEVNELNAQQCSVVLAQNISTSNWWQIRKIAQELSINSLVAHVQAWIEVNFAIVLSSVEFLSLELEDVLYLVENTGRECIESFQVTLFQGILCWIGMAEDNRKEILHELLQRVNLEEIFDNYPEVLYDAFKAGSLLDSDPNCSEIFNKLCRKKALEYSLKLRHTEAQSPKQLRASNRPTCSVARIVFEDPITSSNRLPSRKSTMSHITQNQSVAAPVNSQSSRRNRTSRKSSKAEGLPVKRRKTSLPLSFKDHFDRIGSRSEKFDPDMRLLNYHRRGTPRITAYNFHTSTMETLSESPQIPVRYHSSLVAVEGPTVFHIGGSYESVRRSLQDTEIYYSSGSKILNSRKGPDLCSPVSSAASCKLKDSVYVIGGNYHASDEAACNVLRTTQVLDLSKSAKEWKWELKKNMNCARDSFDVCVYHEDIYAVGGFGITSESQELTRPLRSFERYTPRCDCWSLTDRSQYMQTARAYHKVCVLDFKMYAVGGVTYDSEGRDELFLNTVEAYDFCNGGWTFISPMNENRYDGGGNDNPCKQSAEVYDPRTNTWIPLQWPAGLPQALDQDRGSCGYDNVIEDSYEAAILLP